MCLRRNLVHERERWVGGRGQEEEWKVNRLLRQWWQTEIGKGLEQIVLKRPQAETDSKQKKVTEYAQNNQSHNLILNWYGIMHRLQKIYLISLWWGTGQLKYQNNKITQDKLAEDKMPEN